MTHYFPKKAIWLIAITIILLTLSFYRLDTAPPLWWDEGWTLNVARNWVEQGHYGQLLNGEPRSAGLSGHFPVVATVALSFKLFGIGAWQARLPFAFYTWGVFAIIFILSLKLYNKTVAWVTLAVLLLMTGGLISPPLIEGRQVMGEMPAIFFLLIGYLFLYFAFSDSMQFLLVSIVFWGIALRTKSQVLPFWLVSLAVPIVLNLYRRRCHLASSLDLGWFGRCYTHLCISS